MIPIRRRALSRSLSEKLNQRTQALGVAPNSAAARDAWRRAKTEKSALRVALGNLAHRPSYCMYCLDSYGTDVDHFKPLVLAPHLTFVWENHLLACNFCNSHSKQDRFPLGVSGAPLLIDPTRQDPGEHLHILSTGEYMGLTPNGWATIDVLDLNGRPSVTGARSKVLAQVIGILESAQNDGRDLEQADLDKLEVFLHVDVAHLFTHSVHRGELSKIPRTRGLSAYATRQLPILRTAFPHCSL